MPDTWHSLIVIAVYSRTDGKTDTCALHTETLHKADSQAKLSCIRFPPYRDILWVTAYTRPYRCQRGRGVFQIQMVVHSGILEEAAGQGPVEGGIVGPGFGHECVRKEGSR